MVINHLLDGMILQVTRCFFWRGHWSFPSPVSASGLLDGQVVQVTEDDCHEGDGYHLPCLVGFSLGGSSLFKHGDRKSPKDRVIPLPNGRNLWLINRGDTNHLLTGKILQAPTHLKNITLQ